MEQFPLCLTLWNICACMLYICSAIDICSSIDICSVVAPYSNTNLKTVFLFYSVLLWTLLSLWSDGRLTGIVLLKSFIETIFSRVLHSIQIVVYKRETIFSRVLHSIQIVVYKTLLFGDPELNHRQNCDIFDAVQHFITLSKRFDWSPFAVSYCTLSLRLRPPLPTSPSHTASKQSPWQERFV